MVPAGMPSPTSSSPTDRVPWLTLVTARVVPLMEALKIATGLSAGLAGVCGLLRNTSRVGPLSVPSPVASTPRPCRFCTAEALDLGRAPAIEVLRPVLEAKVSLLALAEPRLRLLTPLCSPAKGTNSSGWLSSTASL